MKHSLAVVIVLSMTGLVVGDQARPAAPGVLAPPIPRIHKLEELSWPQIDRFDRQRTLFILPIGMIEQHGPHLPVGADTIGVTHEANETATRVGRALPDWNVVMMPPINYGQAGANVLGDRLVHPGTYAIRQSTLRALVADLGGELAQNNFKWIFVLNGHGAPTHNIAINEACDFVSETFRVTMLHVTGLFRGDASTQAMGEQINARHFSAADRSAFGLDVHAGVAETSGILAIRPDLVRADYKTLQSRTGTTVEELRAVATAPGWPGYFSSPARATAAHGRDIEEWWIAGLTDLIVRAVRGENMFTRERVPSAAPPAAAPALERALANEAAFDAQLDSWLARRGTR
jgi:creatinine amidohydrolase